MTVPARHAAMLAQEGECGGSMVDVRQCPPCGNVAFGARRSHFSLMCVVIHMAGGTLLRRSLEGAVLMALHAQCLNMFSLQCVLCQGRVPHHRDRICKIVAHAALRTPVCRMVGWCRPILTYRIVTHHAVFYPYDHVRDAVPRDHVSCSKF
jgi:hypothetical protein